MTRALVIGCGGTIGGVWAVAALHALAEQAGWDPRSADILQGTSAGAELVTMLGGGATIADLVAMQQGTTADERLRKHVADAPPSYPPIPFPRLLNPRLLGTQRGLAAATGIAPTGRADGSWLQRLADGFVGPMGWVDHPDTRMVAFDYERGERVAFGAPRSPAADLGAALRASWAVPGWMPPVTIGGRRFVDGGAASTASVDLIDPAEADEIYVIAPMASEMGFRAKGFGGIVEWQLLRRPMSAGLNREIATVRARGTRVITIRPDNTDLAGLGPHFMRRERRREAFDSAMRTAPTTVRRAMALSEDSR